MKELKFDTICGVILAGGKNSRYKGQNKAFLKIGQESFYSRTKNVLADTILISNAIDTFPKDNIPKYEDINKKMFFNINSQNDFDKYIEDSNS